MAKGMWLWHMQACNRMLVQLMRAAAGGLMLGGLQASDLVLQQRAVQKLASVSAHLLQCQHICIYLLQLLYDLRQLVATLCKSSHRFTIRAVNTMSNACLCSASVAHVAMQVIVLLRRKGLFVWLDKQLLLTTPSKR